MFDGLHISKPIPTSPKECFILFLDELFFAALKFECVFPITLTLN